MKNIVSQINNGQSDHIICDTFADLYVVNGVKYTADGLHTELKKHGYKKYPKTLTHTVLRHCGKTVNHSLEYLATCDDNYPVNFGEIIQDKLGIYETEQYGNDWQLFAEFMTRTVEHIQDPTKYNQIEMLLMVGGDEPIWETLFGDDIPYLGTIYTFQRTRDVKAVLKKLWKLRYDRQYAEKHKYQPLRMIGYIIDNTKEQILSLRKTTSKKDLKLITWQKECDVKWLKENRSKVWSFFKDYK